MNRPTPGGSPEERSSDASMALGFGTGSHAFVTDLDHPELEPDDRHHLGRVLRVRNGDSMTVADGLGRWRLCRFGDSLAIAGEIVDVAPVTPNLTIAFALVKGERPELIIQKLTELGIDRIIPFVAGRSVVRPDPARVDKQQARWRRVAREAAMQCRRATLPEITSVQMFDDVCTLPLAVAADRFGAVVSLNHPTVLIGPEGGWEDHERARLPATVGLGVHVLRAETACIAAAALLAGLRAGLVSETN